MLYEVITGGLLLGLAGGKAVNMLLVAGISMTIAAAMVWFVKDKKEV